MERRLKLNLAWYRRYYRDSYNLVKQLRSILETKAQFPNASCPIASRLLLALLPNTTLMCGTFKNNAMKARSLHLWVFDRKAQVHIDITADQFPIKPKYKIIFFRARDTVFMKRFGYKLASIKVWNELFDIGPFSSYNETDPFTSLLPNSAASAVPTLLAPSLPECP